MANLKSSKKDIRRIRSRTERNRQRSNRLKTLRKTAVSALEAGSGQGEDAIRAFTSYLDKSVKNGLVHPNKVSREKSRIARRKRAQAQAASAGPAAENPA